MAIITVMPLNKDELNTSTQTQVSSVWSLHIRAPAERAKGTAGPEPLKCDKLRARVHCCNRRMANTPNGRKRKTQDAVVAVRAWAIRP